MNCSDCGAENAQHLCQTCRRLFCHAGGCPANEGQHHPTIEVETLTPATTTHWDEMGCDCYRDAGSSGHRHRDIFIDDAKES